MSILIVFIFLLAAAGAGIALLLRGLLMPSTVAVCEREWLEDFSVAKYRPMLRLLNESDFLYLAKQPGFSKASIRQLRSERRRIFRGYLRNLIRDFNKLHLAARLSLIYAERELPEFASALLRQRLTFSVAILAVQMRLALHALGLGGVDVSGLLVSVDALRSQVSEFAAASPAPAIRTA